MIDVPLAQATTAAPAAVTAAAGAGAIERASVGIYAITGNPCPASGWWQCQESDALDGTLVRCGQLVAGSDLRRPGRRLWYGDGHAESGAAQVTWQLVRLAHEPETDDSAGKMTDQDGDEPDSMSGGSVA